MSADDLLQSLRSMYWDCVAREVAHLILAYQEIDRHQAEASGYESEEVSLEGEHFERFCKIWRKITAP